MPNDEKQLSPFAQARLSMENVIHMYNKSTYKWQGRAGNEQQQSTTIKQINQLTTDCCPRPRCRNRTPKQNTVCCLCRPDVSSNFFYTSKGLLFSTEEHTQPRPRNRPRPYMQLQPMFGRRTCNGQAASPDKSDMRQ